MALFDQSAEDYDKWYQDPMGKFVDDIETDCIFSLTDNITGSRILDIGCGTGHLSEKLCKSGGIVTGIDISEKMLQKACENRDHLGLHIEYKYMDLYNLVFDNYSFDYVFSMAAFEFIKNIELAFENIRKVLKPNGTIIIGTIHKNSSWAKFYESETFSQTVFASAHFKGLDDFKKIDGFEVVESKECLFVPPGEDEAAYTYDNENRAKLNGNTGGFLCVKMKKS